MQQTDLSLVHNILEPKNAGEGRPPLLLMLHGYGSHENDLFSMAPMLNQKCFIVSARAPVSLPWGGFAWYEIDFSQIGSGRVSDIEQAKKSLEMIRIFIDEIHETYGTDPEEVWVMGFSQGCILSYALALNEPAKFGNVLALSGYIIKDLIPNQYKPEELKGLDFFVSHGTQDDVLPVEWARESVKVLEQLHIRHQYREYPIGHGVSPECFEDLKLWMKDRNML